MHGSDQGGYAEPAGGKLGKITTYVRVTDYYFSERFAPGIDAPNSGQVDAFGAEIRPSPPVIRIIVK